MARRCAATVKSGNRVVSCSREAAPWAARHACEPSRRIRVGIVGMHVVGTKCKPCRSSIPASSHQDVSGKLEARKLLQGALQVSMIPHALTKDDYSSRKPDFKGKAIVCYWCALGCISRPYCQVLIPPRHGTPTCSSCSGRSRLCVWAESKVHRIAGGLSLFIQSFRLKAPLVTDMAGNPVRMCDSIGGAAAQWGTAAAAKPRSCARLASTHTTCEGAS